ncbi:hypothetical protein AB0F15_11315 [Amycolatopsis sp. NPDC026612]|uniref:hypothetical protein n=1 Tax=Amycolatopsis sp. NPDC026612 TaxID=3155466 RepID=UPI00340D532B
MSKTLDAQQIKVRSALPDVHYNNSDSDPTDPARYLVCNPDPNDVCRVRSRCNSDPEDRCY